MINIRITDINKLWIHSRYDSMLNMKQELFNSAAKDITVYSIVNMGGKQHKVYEGAKITCELLKAEIGQEIVIDKVLMHVNNGKIDLDCEGRTVKVQILDHVRERKIIVFKKIRRHRYQRKHGHRQNKTIVQVMSCN